jgi:hypothetical protein
MLLIREIMYCKPGKVRAMVKKSLALAKLMQKSKLGRMRVLTDVSADRYWMCVMEMEVASLGAWEKMDTGAGMSKADGKKMEAIMKGYHDLVDHGRREIYTIEG